MRPIRVVKSSNQNVEQQKPELLKRAKRGDRTAKKKLRELGLLYWEHKGKVIVKRASENDSETNGPITWSFTHKQW